MRRAEVDSNLARVPLHSVVLCAALVQRCRRQRTVLAACARVLTAGVHITLLQQHTLLHRSRIPLRQPSQRLLLRRGVRGKPRPPPLNLSLKAESPLLPSLRVVLRGNFIAPRPPDKDAWDAPADSVIEPAVPAATDTDVVDRCGGGPTPPKFKAASASCDPSSSLRRFNKEADALANAGMDRPAEDAADFNIRPMPEDKAPS